MRKIEFRAWFAEKSLMIGPASLDNWIEGVKEKQLDIYERLEWMQFTGLTDKNGKEIYEGDILAVKLHADSDTWIYVVQWNDKEAQFQINEFEITLYEEVEIISNIYESPDIKLNVPLE